MQEPGETINVSRKSISEKSSYKLIIWIKIINDVQILKFSKYMQDAVKREVLEETGLDMEPTTLLLVESATGVWYRFVLTGTVVGTSIFFYLKKIQA